MEDEAAAAKAKADEDALKLKAEAAAEAEPAAEEKRLEDEAAAAKAKAAAHSPTHSLLTHYSLNSLLTTHSTHYSLTNSLTPPTLRRRQMKRPPISEWRLSESMSHRCHQRSRYSLDTGRHSCQLCTGGMGTLVPF
jgi:hypothetical protein